MTERFYQKHRKFLFFVLLSVATVATYWRVSQCDFINLDDDKYVSENSHVQEGFTSESLRWAFTTMYQANWHPVTWLSHMLDYLLFGSNPAGHHITSAMFHLANSLILFLLFNRMTGAVWKSFFVAAIFVTHPLHVESVAWVAERKDVLSTFFGLLTFWAYVQFTERSSWKWYILAILFFALGLMSKPMLVTLPFLMLLLDYWPLQRFGKGADSMDTRRKSISKSNNINRTRSFIKLVVEKTPFLLLAAASAVITYTAQQGGGAVSSFEILPLYVRFGNALTGFVKYIQKSVWPSGLAVFYPYSPDDITLWKTVVAAFLLIAITFWLLRSTKVKSYYSVGWLWFLGTLVPVIGIIQVGSQSMADRYMYLPMIGLNIIAVWGMWDLATKMSIGNRIVGAIGVSVIILFSLQGGRQVGYWQNNITLFEHAIEVTSGNYIAHNTLGFALAKQGKVTDAINQYNIALSIKPNYADAHNNLGNALFAEGQAREAIAHFTESIKVNPTLWIPHYNLANALAETGNDSAAILHYREVIRLNPGYPNVHNDLGIILSRNGSVEESLSELSEALRLNPAFTQAHYNVGIIFMDRGDTADAIAHFKEAVRLKPDYAEAHFYLGEALRSTGKTDLAIAQYKSAVSIAPTYLEARYKLAEIYSKAEKTDEAIIQYNEILKIAPDEAEAHNFLGKVLFSEGRMREALPHYYEALRLKPSYKDARDNLNFALSVKHLLQK